MRRDPGDAPTPYQAVLFDGTSYFTTLKFLGAHELAAILSLYSRRQLDGVLHAGPQAWGVNPRFVLDAIAQEIRSRVAEAASRLHAQRAVEQAGRAEYGGNGAAKRWLAKARLL